MAHSKIILRETRELLRSVEMLSKIASSDSLCEEASDNLFEAIQLLIRLRGFVDKEK